MPVVEAIARPEVGALLSRGEEQGCVNLSELEDLVRNLEVSEGRASALQDNIEERGLELSDDCGRAGVQPPRYETGELAGATPDALQLFLNELRRYRLL